MDKSQLLNFVFGLLGIYVLLAVFLYLFQRSFIYMPTPQYSHGFEQISLQNQGQSLNIILVNEGNERALIYFGGNAEAVVANAADFATFLPSTTVYLVNYRGYGGSSGRPTESGLFADALAVFDAVSPTHKSVAVMGRSLGSGVAMHLAANRNVSHVALVTPYDSVLALAQRQYPMFPISLLLKDKFDSLSIAGDVSAPVLAIAGGMDTLIPVSHAQKLVDEIGDENAKLIVIERAGHNDIASFPDYYYQLTMFLENAD